jgi:hypothetical protein
LFFGAQVIVLLPQQLQLIVVSAATRTAAARCLDQFRVSIQASLVALCYMALLLVRRPYVRARDDILSLVAQTNIVLLLLVGYLLQVRMCFCPPALSPPGSDLVRTELWHRQAVLLGRRLHFDPPHLHRERTDSAFQASASQSCLLPVWQVLVLLLVLLANLYTFLRFYYYKSLRQSLVSLTRTRFVRLECPSAHSLPFCAAGQRSSQEPLQ